MTNEFSAIEHLSTYTPEDGIRDGVDAAVLLRFSQTMVDRHLTGLWHYSSILTFEALRCAVSWGPGTSEERLEPAEPEDLVASAQVWVSPIALDDTCQQFSLESIDRLDARCYHENAGISEVGRLLSVEHISGSLGEAVGEAGLYLTRALILGHVAVDPRWRGLGIGRRLAARSLYLAGAFADTTVVFAVPAADPGPDSEQLTLRSRNLAEKIGLYPLPSGLCVGFCGMMNPGEVIESLTLS